MTDPADTLARAAQRLRELDEAATDGPWHWNLPGQCCEGGYCLDEAGVHEVSDFYRKNVELIGAMRGLAAPLADWLEGVAVLIATGDPDDYLGFGEPTAARAIARALLGEHE